MRCPECGIVIPYKKAPQLDKCAMCRVPLVPDMRDIFDHGKYNLVKEQRDSQIALAKDIEKILRNDTGTLLAEGGTGIGKSFAYMIPSLLQDKKRIIVATAKKALQDQLFHKDMPYLTKGMGSKKKYVMYKGKSNYGCWLLANEIKDAEDRKRYEDFILDARVNQHPADIANWVGVAPDEKWWAAVHVGNCIMGKNCQHALHCKPQPQTADIVITNHYLLAIDLKLGPGFLLGPYNLLVVDEGHQAPDAFRSVYTRELTYKGLDTIRSMIANNENLRELVDDSGVITAKDLVEKTKELIEGFTSFHKLLLKYTDSIDRVDMEQARANLGDFAEIAKEMNRIMDGIYAATQKMLRESSSSYSDDFEVVTSMSQGKLRKLTRRTKNTLSRVGTINEFVSTVARSRTPEGEERFLLTRTEKSLKVEPLQVGPLVGPGLRNCDHKLIVSATLAMGKDFTHTKQEYGLDDSVDSPQEKLYPTAFNLKKQAVLYAPRKTIKGDVFPLPARRDMPGRDEWIHAISQEIIRLTIATQGDAFVLFSARADMDDVIFETEDALDNAGLNLIVQDGDASAVQKKYLEADKAVLYGLKSFWEGVDIKGEKLKIVIIPKLPFPNPTDPLVKSLSEKAEKEGKKAFVTVMVPKMVADMRQGVGRLIRSHSDRGFVAILDSRIWSSTSNPENHAEKIEKSIAEPEKKRWGYGKNLLDALGYRSITDSFTIVERWVKKFFNKP